MIKGSAKFKDTGTQFITKVFDSARLRCLLVSGKFKSILEGVETMVHRSVALDIGAAFPQAKGSRCREIVVMNALTPVLTKAIFLLLMVNIETAIANCSDDGLTQQITRFTDPLEVVACRGLSSGESMKVTLTDRESLTGERAQYKLVRKATGRYEVQVAPLFSKPFAGHPQESEYRRTLQECFDRISHRVKDNLGNPMEIKILDPNALSPKDKDLIVKVTVWPINGRASSLAWTNGTINECSTMVHETLHWLGLVDEYPEPEKSGWLAWLSGENIFLPNCRAVGPIDSIMRAPEASYFELTRKGVIAKYTACLFLLDGKGNLPSGKCPDGFIEWHQLLRVADGGHVPKPTIELLDVVPVQFDKERSFMKFDGTSEPTLLYPAHIRSILFPGCKAKNRLYYECGKFSGTSGLLHMGCPKTPKECSDPDLWLK